MTERIFRYLREQQPETPCLVVDLDVVEHNFRRMRELLPAAHIFYAVKANPAAQVLARLATAGSKFDTASRGEIELVQAAGVAVDRISFGNTIKKEKDIAWAYQQGVRLFAFDSEAELQKLVRVAPGASVFCRVLVDCGGAEWPLSKKFGCAPGDGQGPAAQGQGMGHRSLRHLLPCRQPADRPRAVGPARWAQVSQMFFALAEDGVDLRMVNLGGGFPARYRAEVNGIEAYCEAVDPRAGAPLRQPHAGGHHRAGPLHGGRRRRDPERGRAGLAARRPTTASAGSISTSASSRASPRPWTRASSTACARRRDGTRVGPVVLAGPTCDSADILYEKTEYKLPLSLKPGDKVEILSTGAYTTTYSSVAFNGFAPLEGDLHLASLPSRRRNDGALRKAPLPFNDPIHDARQRQGAHHGQEVARRRHTRSTSRSTAAWS